jgi:hypothetical protein
MKTIGTSVNLKHLNVDDMIYRDIVSGGKVYAFVSKINNKEVELTHTKMVDKDGEQISEINMIETTTSTVFPLSKKVLSRWKYSN